MEKRVYAILAGCAAIIVVGMAVLLGPPVPAADERTAMMKEINAFNTSLQLEGVSVDNSAEDWRSISARISGRMPGAPLKMTIPACKDKDGEAVFEDVLPLVAPLEAIDGEYVVTFRFPNRPVAREQPTCTMYVIADGLDVPVRSMILTISST